MKKGYFARGAAGLLCAFFMIAGTAGMTGCGKYEEIKLTESTQALEKQEDAGKSETGFERMETGGTDHAVVLEDEESARAADSAAVADLSSLEKDITTATGFTDVDETVWITDDLVNVRSGCGTEYGIVAQLKKGDSVKRTGYSEGWSRILYKDETCYIMSEYLQKAEPEDPDGTAKGLAAFENRVSKASNPTGSPAVSNGRIVAIDAGHQAKGNSEKEPIGPGSSTTKAKMAAGAEGISTKLPEYKLTLSVAQKVKRILEERGYQVVMIRESSDVNISNAERAEMANQSGASVFVRIHANSLDNTSVHGTLSMCQTAQNPYNGELHDRSYSLSKKITDAVCAAAGFKNRGVQETDTMSGINWCTIPVTIVEMGFMSNPEEDQKMAQDEYQELIAGGIANGIDAYFGD